ncbi:MAG: hypothetical protein ACLSAF_03680 [Intestinimonas sp.]
MRIGIWERNEGLREVILEGLRAAGAEPPVLEGGGPSGGLFRGAGPAGDLTGGGRMGGGRTDPRRDRAPERCRGAPCTGPADGEGRELWDLGTGIR